MSREVKVHFDNSGRPRCGNLGTCALDGDRGRVTCLTCAALLNGTQSLQVTNPRGYQWADVRPCGTPAAYKRHLRRTGKPVRCETCLQGERRRTWDRAEALRELRRAALWAPRSPSPPSSAAGSCPASGSSSARRGR